MRMGEKDISETAGIRTTAHSKLLHDFVPRRDATVVSRLAAAGTILLGKTATHEFALGGPSFDLPWPPARNPWDTSRFTGGSGSGPRAAGSPPFVLRRPRPAPPPPAPRPPPPLRGFRAAPRLWPHHRPRPPPP